MDDTIGAAIRRRRTESGLSQTRLAKALGTSRQRVILWESDKHAPSPAYAAALAEALGGTEVDYLPPPYQPLTLRSELDELRQQTTRLAGAVDDLGRGQAAGADALQALADRVYALEQRASPQTRQPRSRRQN